MGRSWKADEEKVGARPSGPSFRRTAAWIAASAGAHFLWISALEALVFRFDRGLLMEGWVNLLASSAVLLLPVMLAARRLTARLVSAGEGCGSPSDSSNNGTRGRLIEAVENYPIRIGILAFTAFVLLGMEHSLFLFLRGDLLGFLALNLALQAVCVGACAAMLLYFFLHRELYPLRREVYPRLGGVIEARGLTLKHRVLALAALITATSIVLGWTTSNVSSVHVVQEQLLEKSRIHAKLLGDQLAGLLCARITSHSGLAAKVKSEQLDASEYVELLDREGNVVEAFNPESGEKEPDSALLAEARSAALEDHASSGSFKDRRGGMIAAYAPTGYYGMNLVAVVPISPFLGITWKVGLAFLLLGLVVATISAAMTWFTVKSFSPPLSRLLAATREVGRGNLATVITVDSADETGELSQAFRNMQESLRRMIGSSQQTALQVMDEASGNYSEANTISSSMGKVNHSIKTLTASAREERERLERFSELAREASLATSRMAVLVNEVALDSQDSLDWLRKSMELMERELSRGSGFELLLSDLFGCLLKMAELSEGIVELSHQAIEQNSIITRDLEEIRRLSEGNVSVAEQINNSVESNSMSLERLAASSQRLAELAVLLQAQTAEFVLE